MGDRKFANTLARGLSVLRAFRISDDGLTHAQVIVRTGLAPATITRLTHTLKELGYLSQKGSLLRLGPTALALASVANASSSFLDIAESAMEELANSTKTLVIMAVPDGSSMTLVRTWRPQGVVSIWMEPGNRVPIGGSSTGQSLLSALSDDRFNALKPSAEWQALRADGQRQLAERGFNFVPEGERYTETINAVARPYCAGDLGAPAVFSCGGTPEMLTDERILNEVGPALREVVRHLEDKTGAAAPMITAHKRDI